MLKLSLKLGMSWEYQIDISNKILDYFYNGGRRAVLSSAPGSGKTKIAAMIINQLVALSKAVNKAIYFIASSENCLKEQILHEFRELIMPGIVVSDESN